MVNALWLLIDGFKRKYFVPRYPLDGDESMYIGDDVKLYDLAGVPATFEPRHEYLHSAGYDHMSVLETITTIFVVSMPILIIIFLLLMVVIITVIGNFDKYLGPPTEVFVPH